MAGATRESYTSARAGRVAISNRDVVLKNIQGARHENAGIAVRRRGHACNCGPGAGIDDDSVIAEPLDDTRSANRHAGLVQDANAVLSAGPVAAGAARLRVRLSRHSEATQIECDVAGDNIEAGAA